LDNEDIVTIKYDAAGNQQWLQRFNGPPNLPDVPGKIKLSSSNRVYVIGKSANTMTTTSFFLPMIKGQEIHTSGSRKFLTARGQDGRPTKRTSWKMETEIFM
jgi:hypothetical protein